jgi:hypothetical protein
MSISKEFFSARDKLLHYALEFAAHQQLYVDELEREPGDIGFSTYSDIENAINEKLIESAKRFVHASDAYENLIAEESKYYRGSE